MRSEDARRLLPEVYRLLKVLEKSSSDGQALAWAQVARIREKHDDDFEEVFSDWLSGIQDTLAGLDADTKAGYLSAIEDAFSTDPLLQAYAGVLDDFLASFVEASSKYIGNTIDIDYDVVNTKATATITDAVQKYFGDFASGQMDRIKGILEDGIASGSPTRDIASALAEGMSSIVYLNDDGSVMRTLSPDVWATQVARTESNRAYAGSVKAALQSAKLQTWQCIVADDERTCDECEPNSDAIVAIGDDLPSGDDPPPIHSNCRCTMIAVTEEITGQDDDDED